MWAEIKKGELIIHIPVRYTVHVGDKSVPDFGFSVMEQTVLTHLLTGKQNKEIANELHLSVRTVKFHVSAIFRKTGLRSRHQVLQFFNNVGLTSALSQRDK